MSTVLQPFHDSITAELSALRQEIRSMSTELDTSGSSTHASCNGVPVSVGSKYVNSVVRSVVLLPQKLVGFLANTLCTFGNPSSLFHVRTSHRLWRFQNLNCWFWFGSQGRALDNIKFTSGKRLEVRRVGISITTSCFRHLYQSAFCDFDAAVPYVE